MKSFTIGQVASLADVGVETVRFYERKGLIEVPARSASGYRQYSQEFVSRLRFIRQAKELGFSLKEIQELLELRFDPSANCSEVRKRAEIKIADIDDRIKALRKMKKALSKLTSSCSGQGPVSECPILNTLDG